MSTAGPPGVASRGATAIEADPLVVMAKPVGPLCNLDCRYCYYLDKTGLFARGERYRMSDAVLEAYVREFIAASPGPTVHFVWHGGEPTLAGRELYRRALDYQARYLPQGWRAVNNLQTNGTLLDDRWCSFLAANEFSVGLSLDGPAALHDAGRPDRRGRPSHERALRGLELLRSHGIEPDVLCTLNAATATAPLGVYRFFLDAGVRWLQFLPVVRRTGDGAVTAESVPAEAMGEFLCTIFDEWVRNDVDRIGIQNFLECLLVAGGISPNLCVMAETCGRVPAVEHDGSVYSCDHFVDAEHRLGNLTATGLLGLVDSAEQEAFGAAKLDLLAPGCRACPVLRYCNGGCPKDRFLVPPPVDRAERSVASGSIPHGGTEVGLNYLCAGYRRFYGHVHPYAQRMALHVRSGRPIATIMGELAAREREERARWSHASRNEACPCGSGRKYKHCCLGARRR